MSRHDRAMNLFDQAADLPPDERRAFLASECGNEPTLLAEVQQLLAADDTAGAFLSDPAFNPADAAAKIVGGETVGTRIGSYKLLELIGEGGFGRVFLADQERPVRRRVALKIIKLGMDTRQVIARFEAERQALAIMDHPNIAKVFDAGATITGRPYFVMELVRGVPITRYCDQNKLGVRARLKLFVYVCQAIQHAHQKGVIHRDLKPSNVLVTMIDGQAVPKIIDFGIAKATSQQTLTDRTIYTEYHQFIGTPAYMSPEQAAMSGDDIDTRSDIYSLGVLLYELLTGTTPFDPRSIQNATYADVQKLIREVDPPKPSTRIYSVRETLREVAAARGGEPRQLRHLFKGELDWIVMKCLEKQRSRRYDSAGALATDLLAFLNNRPVAAAPPSRIYLARKFVSRHAFVFGVAAAVVIALAVGLVGSVLALQRLRIEQENTKAALAEAERQRREAQDANQSTLAINEFVNQMLASANPENARSGPLTVEDILNNAAAGLGDRFHDRPDVEAGIRQTLGMTFSALDNDEAAAEHLAAAMEIRAASGTADRPEYLQVKATLALTQHALGQYQPARKLFLEVVQQAREELERDGTKLVPAVDVLASSASYVDAPEEQSQALFALAANRRSDLLGPDHPATLKCRMMAAWYLALTEKPKEAEVELRATLDGMRRVLGPAGKDTLACQEKLAKLLVATKRVPEGLALAQDALAAAEKQYSLDNPISIAAASSLSSMYNNMGRYEEVLALELRRIEAIARVYGENSSKLGTAYVTIADVHEKLGRADEAFEWRRKRLENSRIANGPDSMLTLFAEVQLGDRLLVRGDYTEATRLYDHAIPLLRKQLPPGHRIIDLLASYAKILHAAGRGDEALAAGREAHEGAVKLFPEAPVAQRRFLAPALVTLGALHVKRGEYAQAEPMLRAAIKTFEEANSGRSNSMAVALEHLEILCRETGRDEEAAQLASQLAQIKATTQPSKDASARTQ